ncbi:MAG: spermidine/putrescine ABC transporter substrate-binding protein [Spirochaetaceae bacterium]|jgi:spermidine/putrescine-binding protein|nr:spermidine/putrescine ABC transporter substrate-binding protein [Spirochaetaceae bacterium]
MKKLRLLLLMLPALAVIPLTQLSAQNKQLILYTWEDMFPQDIIDGFKQATGIEVIYKTFEFNEDMLTELEITEGAGYDLVIADDYIIEFVIAEGLARKLDKSRMNNFSNINSLFQYQFYDPANEYTVPYGAGIQTIVYDPAKVPLDIQGFGDLWNSALRGRLGITANYRVINGMALKALGKSYNTEDISEINAAGAKLNALIPNIRVFQDLDLDKAMLAGEISAAVMYTGEVTRVRIANSNLKEVYPLEGIGFGIQAAFVPSRAPNAEGAYAFLNYIMDPRRGARCFEYSGYYCTYSASEAFISPQYKPHIILPNFNDFEMIENLGREAENAHTRIWRTFRSALKR